jgi:alginate O-acetyltransferase complex protein AlgJ
MSRFLKKVFVFILIPFILWIIVEESLPITFFTSRHYEAVFFRSSVPHKYQMYPNVSSKMNAVGDLCHHTKLAIIKKEDWKTDKIGFRNDNFIEQPDILIIGDSYIMGTSLSQENTLTNQLNSKFGCKVKVYNMAPSTFTEFNSLLKQGILKKPKIIIYSRVERLLSEPIDSFPYPPTSKFAKLMEYRNINKYVDKVLRTFSLNWIKARLSGAKGEGVPGIENSNMYFVQGKDQYHSEENFQLTVKYLGEYKKYCDARGIQFLFLPMPDKESVYYDMVPFKKQPNYLFRLDSILHTLNIPAINVLQLYNNYRKNNDKLLYHYDDSHWNSNATDLVSKEIRKRIEVKEKDVVLKSIF